MASNVYSSRPHIVSPKESHHNLHIAIDFGTDGLGIAYAFNNDIYIQNEWSSNKYGTTIKPKCIALFDSNKKLVSFGIDAKHQYINLLPKQQSEWMLFEQFKMALYTKPDLNGSNSRNRKKSINKVLTALNGKQMSSENVFIAVFKYIYIECYKWLKNKKLIDIINDDEIEWIITVPSIWNDSAKHFMKKWANSAGLKYIRIVYESDCASLAIQYDLRKKKMKFRKKDKYILVDAGGGTVDIAFHEILSKFGVKEILSPFGGKWGSCYIDEKFNHLLNKIFGKQYIDQFKEKISPIKYMELMNNFILSKTSCFYNNNNYKLNDNHNIELPLEFIEYLQKIYNDCNLTEKVRKTFKKKDPKKLYLENNNILSLNMKTWQRLFDHVIDPLLSAIRKLLLNQSVLKHSKYLCLVGGLSKSPYFINRMEDEFGKKSIFKLEIITTSQPMLSVVKGAAYFGITKHFIKSRILNKTYGVRINLSLSTANKLGIPNKHIFNNLAYNIDNKMCHIRNCFEMMAFKGEEIMTNQVKIRKSKRLNNKQKSIIKYIICSDMEKPKIINDGEIVGSIKFDFNYKNNINDMIIYTEFHFYDTMLKVFVYPANKPHLKKEVELSYY